MTLTDSCNIVSVGGWAEIARPSFSALERLKKELTLFKKSDGRVVPIPLYEEKEGSSLIGVPRSWPYVAGLDNIRGTWESLGGVKSSIILKPDQLEIAAQFQKGLADHPYGGILKATTGFGKSVLGISLLIHLGLKTLIVVPVSGLIDDEVNGWIPKLLQFTNLRRSDIGIIRQNRCEYKNKKVCIALIHSLVAREGRYPEEFYRTFGTTIYDEVHRLGAETFARVAPMFFDKTRVGLSATPRRTDGMENAFLWHIGPVLVDYSKRKVKPTVVFMKYYDQFTNDQNMPTWAGISRMQKQGMYLSRLAECTERTQMIFEIVFRSWKVKKDILVLSDRKEILRQIHSMLVARSVLAKDIGWYVHGNKNATRPITLGTYGSCSTGIDSPHWRVLLAATPRKDMEQAVGRVLREGSPIVIEIVDTASRMAKMLAWSKYEKFYKHIAGEIRGTEVFMR